MMTPEQKRVAVLDYKRRYRARHRNAQTIGVCDCGDAASYWSSGGYVCEKCRKIEAACLQHDLRNDRVKVPKALKGKMNPEYLKRYGHEYHKNKHLPKEVRCALARAAAATPLAVIEAEQNRKCECGYPAIEGGTRCIVCERLSVCH